MGMFIAGFAIGAIGLALVGACILRCEHKWEIEGKFQRKCTHSWGETSTTNVYVQRCTKCGKLRSWEP